MEGFLTFDLETQRSAEEVGGWGNIDKMLFSVAVVWDSSQNKFFYYYADQYKELANHLFCGLKVVGFNHLYFDYKVLAGCFKAEQRQDFESQLLAQKNLDLLIDIKNKIGFRVRLENLAKSTLNTGKSADGLDALKWYKEYQNTGDSSFLEKIAKYCKQDVEVTKNLYEYGLENGFVYCKEKTNNIRKIMVEWKDTLTVYPATSSKKSASSQESLETLF